MSRAGSQGLVLLLAVGLLLSGRSVRAQIAPDSARLAVKASVSGLLSGTYEVEVERRCGQHFSFSVAPHVVAGKAQGQNAATAISAPTTSDDRVHGFGLALGARYYIPNTGTDGTSLSGMYLGLKGEYRHLRFDYQREGWGEEMGADGLSYYTLRMRDFSETIGRYGGAATLGYQCQVFLPRLRFDASTSLNALQSRSSAGESSRYRSSKYDYGYSGLFWTLGLSLGFVIR